MNRCAGLVAAKKAAALLSPGVAQGLGHILFRAQPQIIQDDLSFPPVRTGKTPIENPHI
jgi:hypothetical protein